MDARKQRPTAGRQDRQKTKGTRVYYMIFCLDKPDSDALRTEFRPIHLQYLRDSEGTILTAGAHMDEDGKPRGSLYIVDVPDRAAAEAFIQNDPFSKAGVFGSIDIRAWRKAVFDHKVLI